MVQFDDNTQNTKHKHLIAYERSKVQVLKQLCNSNRKIAQMRASNNQ